MKDNIDLYLMKQLSKAETASFEQQLKTDKEFSQRVANRKEELFYVKLLHQENQRNKIKDILAENQPSQNKKHRILYYASIAAGIALLVFAANFMFNNQSNPSLADQYYKPYSIATRNSEGNNTSSPVKNALRLYNEGQYKKVIPLLELQIDNDLRNRLLLGIAYYEEENFDASLMQFSTLMKMEDKLYRDQAYWYGALSALNLKDRIKAKSFLQQLSKGSEYYNNAQKLLLELDK